MANSRPGYPGRYIGKRLEMTYKAPMDMAQSLDEALLEALASARERPAIVRPYFDAGADFDALINNIEKQHAQANSDYANWREKGNARQDTLSALFEKYEVEEHHIANCRKTAELVEENCDEYAKDISRQAKQLDKIYKQLKVFDPVRAKTVRDIFEKTLAVSRQEVEDRLSFALLMRALAAQYDPDKKIVAYASSPEEVEDVFRQLLQ